MKDAESSFLLNHRNYQLKSTTGDFQDFLLLYSVLLGEVWFCGQKYGCIKPFPNPHQAPKTRWKNSETRWVSSPTPPHAGEALRLMLGGDWGWNPCWTLWLDSQSKPGWGLWHHEKASGFEGALPPSSPSKTPWGLWNPSSALYQSTH